MMTIDLRTGSGILEVIDEVASLRLEIFQEFPYLYVGRREDELNYLGHYAKVDEACVILARDEYGVIGAVTGMPLLREDQHMIDAFKDVSMPLDDFYYVGELLFRQGHRNGGNGQKLLASLLDQVRSLGPFKKATCATVTRPENHPLRPRDFIPITQFLARTGFLKLGGVTANFAWNEVDGVRRDHAMEFWYKSL